MKNVGLISLGCAKNRVDGEVLLGILRAAGMNIVSDPEQADYIFVNTCGFIEPAKEESIEAIFEAAEYKSGRLKKLFVTGCLSQRYPEQLSQEIPEVDGFLGVSQYSRVMEMIALAEDGKRPCFVEEGDRFLKDDRVLTTEPFAAYVKISDGCDNRCTYCAIPLIRGGYASRPYEDIMDECRRLAARGVTEITLIAQDTSRYGTDFDGNPRLLPRLLRDVSEIDGVKWVRVLYCYPDTVDDALLDEIQNNPKVAKYLDLPLQHINDDLLRRMNRRGSSEYIRKTIEKCHERGIMVRTTFIVGFPGETEEQFEELLGFVQTARFDRMGAFTYSPEEGTAAAEMPDQIDEEVKQRRLDELMMCQQEISLELNEARIGEELTVLVVGVEDNMFYGRSLKETPEGDGVIFLSADYELTPGEYVRARISRAEAYDLYAEVI